MYFCSLSRKLQSLQQMEQILSDQEPGDCTDRTLTEIEESLYSLRFRVYGETANRHSEGLLLHDKRELKREIEIMEATAIYVHHQTSQTKLISISNDSSSKKRSHVDQEGFTLLIEVFPKFIKGNCRSFQIARFADESLTCEKDLFRNTFVTLKTLDDSRLKRIKLKDADIIKFGRESFRVSLGKQEEGPKWYDKVYHQQSLLEEACRICLSHEKSHPQDYLISPCNCSGSCAYTHIECLRKWIRNRMTLRQKGNIISYNFQKRCCQICKSDLPNYISIAGNMIQLLPLSIGSCLILERLNFEGRGKVIHCINVKANQERIILLGRNDTNDLILDEMSISRVHAKLIITKEGVDLYDCNSKFGTFVMLRGQLTHLKDVNLMSNKWAFELAISCE